MKGPSVYYPLLIVCTCFLLGVASLGTLHADYIYPLTQDYVSIPTMGADHFIGTTTIASNLRGEFPDGFNINAVGGISLHSTGDNVVNVPGDISYSAPAAGDVALLANTIDIHSQADVNIWAANNGVFNVANDLHIESIIGNGDFKIQSYLNTNIDAIHGIEIGSLFRETYVLAPNGIAELSSDIINFITGDEEEPRQTSFQLLSNDTIDIRATKTFIVDSQSITFQSVEDTTITSNVHNVEIESLHLFNISATSNVILKSVSNTYFDTLLSDFTAHSDGVVSFYAHGGFFYAESISLSSDNTVRLDSSGSVKFTDTTFTTIDANTINLNARPGEVAWTSTTGNIDIVVDELNVFSDNIYLTTSHVPGSTFNISTQAQVSFLASDNDIHFESTFTDLESAGNIAYGAASDIYMVAVRHANQANFISPDGFSSYTADKEFTVEANEINLQANGGIIFNDATFIDVNADKTMNILSHNLFYQSSTFLIDYKSATATISAGHDNTFSANTIVSNFDSANHYATGDLSVTAEPTKESSININSDSLNIYSSEGGAYYDASTIRVNADRRIDFQNDFETPFGNQEFRVNSGFELFFLGATASFTSGTSNNLLAPTGSIETTSVFQTEYSGNEGLFKSITGSIFFNDGEFSAQGNTLNLRAGQSIQWNSDGHNVSMDATTLLFESGTDIELISNLIDLDTTNDIKFNSDSRITVLSQGDLPFTAAQSVYVQGGELTFTNEGNATFTANTAEFSSGNSQDINFSADSMRVVADTDITYAAGGSVSLETTSEVNNATGDLIFTSNSDEDVSFISDNSGISVTNLGNTNFAADFLQSDSLGDFNVQLDNDFSLTADSASIISNNNIELTAVGSFSITGVTMSTTLAPFQFDLGTYDITGPNEWTSCTDDIRLNVGTYTYTSEGSLPIYQLADPCGTPSQPGNFEIVSRSNRTQTINTNYISYDGDNSININGGGLLFRTLDQGFGSINFTTDNGVTFQSSNYPNHLLSDPSNDALTASGNLNITINGAAHFIANGFDNNFAYPNYGILMETNISPLYSKNTNYTIKVPNGQINENAANVLRIATLQPLDNTAASLTPQTQPNFLGQYQDLTVAVTRDILFDGGLGSITTIAGGQLNDDDDSVTTEDDDEFEDNSSINLRAVIGDITAKADLAQMIFNAQYLFSATSADDSITFTSLLDQTHSSQRKDGDLLYHSNFGRMNFTDKLDTSIIAGSPTQDASINAFASNQIYVTSGQSQVYSTTGATTDATGIAINIIGEEGGILASTPSNIAFYSSAREEVTANTGILTVTANNNIDFLADGRIDYVSQLTSNFTVTNGNIDVNAFGGGGSVSVTSDDGQDITGLAGQGIDISAASSSSIYAVNGISALSHTGDISLSNAGVNQNMFFLSQGSVNIQAAATAGVSIYGYSFHADAFQDVLFDSNFFTVDSTSDTTTSTEPIIEIHAGGDTTTEGIIVNSAGQMQWTTSEAAGVHFVGNKIDIDATVDVRMTTNGPILFENLAEENDGTFTITTTTGTLTVNGNENAGIVGVTEAQFNTEGSITLQSIGTDAGNGVQILTRRDLQINANDFEMTTSILEAELTDFQIHASDLITIQNTIGDSGSLLIDSDLSLDLTSSGPVLITSLGPATISTYGKIANINFDSRSDETLTSGDSTFFSAITMETDAPRGIDFTSTGGAMEITASDAVTFIANETLSINGRQSLEISTGALDSTFFISSTENATFVASNDISIDTSSGQVTVTADTGISIENRIPSRTRDQGDIFIQSYGELGFTSGDDSTYTVGRFYDVTVAGNSRYVTGGDVTFDATFAGASILLSAEAGSFDVVAGADMTLNTQTFIASATQDFFWEQTYEEGFGGITISSTASNAPFTITSSGSTTFEATTSIEGTSNGYISFFSDNLLTIESFNSEGDIIFNSLRGDVEIDVGGSFIYDFRDPSDEYKVVIESLASQATTDTNAALYIESTGDIIQLQTEDNQNSIITKSGGSIIFATADLPNLDISSESQASTNFIANGISENLEYGIYVETDDVIRFDAGAGNITAHSVYDKAYFNASETYTIFSNVRANFYGGDDFLIFTGFTPQPNADLPNRIGIEFNSNREILFSSNYNDVIFQAEDSSWTIGVDTYFRSSSNGGNIQFVSDNEPMTIRVDGTASFNPTELALQSFGDTAITATNNIIFTAAEDLTIQAPNIFPNTLANINIASDRGDIIFLSPFGAVNFQPTGLFNTLQHLLIPQLQYQAGISQITTNYPWYVKFPFGYIPPGTPNGPLIADKFQLEIENEYPGCEERSFGFDEISETMCICDFNKWRCTETWGEDYAYLLYQLYYPVGINPLLSSPLFY